MHQKNTEEKISKRKKQLVFRNRLRKILTGILIFILCIYMAIGIVGVTMLEKLTDDM